MQSLSILITASTDAFPSPPVLIDTRYSHLNFAMLGVTMLRDVHRQTLFVAHVRKIFGNNLANSVCRREGMRLGAAPRRGTVIYRQGRSDRRGAWRCKTSNFWSLREFRSNLITTSSKSGNF